MIVGILLAVLAGVGAFVVGSGSQSSGPPPVATTPVVVAARDLARLTAIAAADVKVEQYPVTIAPPSAMKDPREAIGKVVSVTLAAGEPLLPTKFGTSATGASFTVFPPSAQPAGGQPIPPGTPDYRAMSITVPDANAVGGAVQPGDFVDIMYIAVVDPVKFFQGQQDQNRVADSLVKVVLQNVPILTKLASVYTIRTDAQGAERITYLTSAGGQLQMLLRAGQDQRTAATTGATFADIYKTFNLRVPAKINP
jgi:pilus assembly protein CpaB